MFIKFRKVVTYFKAIFEKKNNDSGSTSYFLKIDDEFIEISRLDYIDYRRRYAE